jgi:hypothetical protein
LDSQEWKQLRPDREVSKTPWPDLVICEAHEGPERVVRNGQNATEKTMVNTLPARLLKIPNTWLYVAFNANLGQKTAGAGLFEQDSSRIFPFMVETAASHHKMD